MRKLREIARLKFAAGRTFEEIAAAVGIARSTVQTALGRLSAAGLSWPWPAALDEARLNRCCIRVSRDRRAQRVRYRTLPRSQ